MTTYSSRSKTAELFGETIILSSVLRVWQSDRPTQIRANFQTVIRT